jgi:hypothetical protein
MPAIRKPHDVLLFVVRYPTLHISLEHHRLAGVTHPGVQPGGFNFTFGDDLVEPPSRIPALQARYRTMSMWVDFVCTLPEVAATMKLYVPGALAGGAGYCASARVWRNSGQPSRRTAHSKCVDRENGQRSQLPSRLGPWRGFYCGYDRSFGTRRVSGAVPSHPGLFETWSLGAAWRQDRRARKKAPTRLPRTDRSQGPETTLQSLP